MTFDIRRIDLAKLNSLTKYPSIPTYHTLGEKGALQDAVQVPFSGRIVGTEKVDGTNARLVFCPYGSVVVGSREDLLWERRDLIGNPSMGIVEAIREAVSRLHPTLCRAERLLVLYVEVYGRNIGGAAKQYTGQGKVGFRLFDAVVIDNFDELLTWPTERIAHWRDEGGQKYLPTDQLAELAREIEFEPVPSLFDLEALALPTDLEETYRFLLGLGPSRCRLDEAAGGMPEGVVVRSPDRGRIAKLRREDYERTLRRRQGKR